MNFNKPVKIILSLSYISLFLFGFFAPDQILAQTEASSCCVFYKVGQGLNVPLGNVKAIGCTVGLNADSCKEQNYSDIDFKLINPEQPVEIIPQEIRNKLYEGPYKDYEVTDGLSSRVIRGLTKCGDVQQCDRFLWNQADTKSITDQKAGALPFTPNVTIPGFTQTAVDENLLPNYLKALYKFLVGMAGLLAVVMIAFGGVLWLVSGGSSDKISKAKEMIFGAIIGLILALTSYLILNAINPALVIFKPLEVNVPGVPHIGSFCGLNEPIVSADVSKKFGADLTCGETAQLPGQPNTSCVGSLCQPDSGDVCYFNPGMQTANCLNCMGADKFELDKNGITRTDAGCLQLTPEPLGSNNIPICVFTEDTDVNYGVNLKDTCALIDVDCNAITSCDKYDDVSIIANTYTKLDNVEKRHLERICTKDKNGYDSKWGICGKSLGGDNQHCYMASDSDCRLSE